ncbi:MAG: FtsK/SpoIIIE domain-containing protein, partial [Rhodospirillales bacterium]|nr:FtsK/SpoIIIE domain-containing protein [Rhodospirillales bacterium]
LHPVVTDPKKSVAALRWAVREMNSRYQTMSLLQVRNVEAYNRKVEGAVARGRKLSREVQTGFDAETGKPVYELQTIEPEPFPYLVIVVDEMADLMLSAGKDFELAIQALAQKARAAGIHLIVATQRPSVDVVTGTIKANLPCRISFQVSSATDSRTVLGDQGAEQLLGKGDMLYQRAGGKMQRVHGPFVSDEEVERVADFLRNLGISTEYNLEVTEEVSDAQPLDSSEETGRDALYDDAVALLRHKGKASTSFLQRHLQIGYNRAARMIDQLESDGIVSPADHTGKREVIG